MKKGLLNIITLALIITNVILTVIIVFAVVPALNASNDLVSKVASAIDIQKEKETDNSTITLSQTELYSFSGPLTITLKKGSDGNQHHAKVSITLSLNTKDSSYDEYKGKLSSNETLMKSIVNTIIMNYTVDEFTINQTLIQEEILAGLRELFDNTTFIYKVSFDQVVTS